VRVYHAPRHAIFAATIFAVTGLAGAATPAQAQDNSKDNTRDSTNAAICAPSDETAVSPEQRIAACTALTEKLKDQPQALAAALTDRGATYWYINRWDLAVKDLDRAIALDPNNARAFRERSNGYRSIGRLDRALADANKAVQLDPNDPKAFDNRGNVFIDDQQYDRALADFNEALRLKPDFALAYHDRGDAYYFKQAMRRRSRIWMKRSGSIRKAHAPSPIAPRPTGSSAGSIKPLPTTPRRSGSTR
jgi:tetratricopeptide (TPR) repeat protein